MSTDAPHALEVVRRSLLDERQGASRMLDRGLVMLALVPVTIFAAVMLGMWFDTLAPLVLASLYTLVGGIFGMLSIGGAVVTLRRTKRELRELEDSRLPKARLLT